MAQYVLDASLRSRLLVDFVDVDSEKWVAYAATKKFPLRQIYRREARRLLRFDRAVAARADASIFVSQTEADLFRIRAPEVRNKVAAISNGVNSTYFSPENAGERPNFPNRPVIVFTGHMNYWPNVDAVVWFSDSVLPKIREKFPDATFYIVGAHPSAVVQALGSRPGIVVTGKVADVRPYIGHADVVVAPLRIGREFRTKCSKPWQWLGQWSLPRKPSKESTRRMRRIFFWLVTPRVMCVASRGYWIPALERTSARRGDKG